MRSGIIAVLLLSVVAASLVVAYRTGLLPVSSGTEATEISPEAASSAEAKIARLQRSGQEARLNSVELTSLFKYRPEVWSIDRVLDPQVSIRGDTMSVSGSFATAELPRQAELEQIRFLLPDTTDVAVSGTLDSASTGQAVFRIASIEVAGMPIPSRLFPLLLERIGGGANAPPNAIGLPLPDAVGSVRLEDGELVLTP
ncbi:MAG: hypothetical protein WD766_11235 [Gemmatimonadota bacterium]